MGYTLWAMGYGVWKLDHANWIIRGRGVGGVGMHMVGQHIQLGAEYEGGYGQLGSDTVDAVLCRSTHLITDDPPHLVSLQRHP